MIAKGNYLGLVAVVQSLICRITELVIDLKDLDFISE